MTKKLVTLFAFLMGMLSYGQVVINELDADTPSTDVLEFIELKSNIPNYSLNGYVLVFFNGSSSGTSTTSYYALDLDGYVTDINGIIHFGNSQVSPTPAFVIPNTTIQNGPDAVGLYLANASDFPNGTTAISNGLVDSLAYSNSATVQPTALMAIFGTTVCVNENQTLSASTKSIQRKVDGTYEIKTPTPGVNNDGSGIVLNYISVTPNVTNINEGQTLQINFSTSIAVSNQPLTFDYTFTNGTFNSSDFSGTTTVTIPVGSTTATTANVILNDGTNEGDEELKIAINAVPTGYSLNNNDVIVRVNDMNFNVLPFGTPANPTHGNVTSTAPSGYYASLEGLSGNALKQEIQNIIANPAVVRAHNYADIVEILKTADQNPENSNQVWLIYTEQPRSKIDYQTGNSIIGKWNREHIYCQSRGGYSNGNDYLTPSADGITVWSSTGPDDIGAGVADAHHIRAVDGQENSSRNNRNYGIDYVGPTGNPGSWKGDVARAVFYMAVRYNGLNVVNGDPVDNIVGQIGDLTSLLAWNHQDTSDDFELNRNNYIYTWQYNRNPFIDYPDLADYIWGANVGQPWHALSNTAFSNTNVVVYPNPAKGNVTISGITEPATVSCYSVIGTKLLEQNTDGLTVIDTSSYNKGVYFIKIAIKNQVIEKKLIIE